MGGRRRVGQGDWTAASLLFDLRGGASSLGVSARTRSTGLKAPVCLGVRRSCFDGFPVKWARLAWWSSATRRSQTGLLRLRLLPAPSHPGILGSTMVLPLHAQTAPELFLFCTRHGALPDWARSPYRARQKRDCLTRSSSLCAAPLPTSPPSSNRPSSPVHCPLTAMVAPPSPHRLLS
jgi:hypothetical protein